jgi:citrate synthase
MTDNKETLKTSIWFEEAEADNPYAASACYCSGYDVYGDLLTKVSWVQYLYLLFRLELPDSRQARLLETLAVAVANPGIRDHSVQAAMNAGVAGSTRASALMAAVAVGAGNLGGGRDLYHAMGVWQHCGCELQGWLQTMASPPERGEDSWLAMEHFPGFDPNGNHCAKPVLQILETLVDICPGGSLQWLMDNRRTLEQTIGYPLTYSGVCGAAFHDLGFSPAQGEMLYLLLRLPGAAAHALEQEQHGWRQFPFFRSALKPASHDDYCAVRKSFGDSP